MQMITMIIRPHKYEEVREALLKIGVQGITITQVKGGGRQRGQAEIYRGAEYQTHEISKLRLEIAVASDMVQTVVTAIQKSAKTGKAGDGNIFIHPLEQATRIRTSEEDTAALD